MALSIGKAYRELTCGFQKCPDALAPRRPNLRPNSPMLAPRYPDTFGNPGWSTATKMGKADSGFFSHSGSFRFPFPSSSSSRGWHFHPRVTWKGILDSSYTYILQFGRSALILYRYTWLYLEPVGRRPWTFSANTASGSITWECSYLQILRGTCLSR